MGCLDRVTAATVSFPWLGFRVLLAVRLHSQQWLPKNMFSETVPRVILYNVSSSVGFLPGIDSLFKKDFK